MIERIINKVIGRWEHGYKVEYDEHQSNRFPVVRHELARFQTKIYLNNELVGRQGDWRGWFIYRCNYWSKVLYWNNFMESWEYAVYMGHLHGVSSNNPYISQWEDENIIEYRNSNGDWWSKKHMPGTPCPHKIDTRKYLDDE